MPVFVKSFDDDDDDSMSNSLEYRDAVEELLGEFEGLPTVLFACNVPTVVFEIEETKKEFESMFKVFGSADFIYLLSFRRVRIAYQTSKEAGRAKCALHETLFKNELIKVYYAQSSSDNAETSTSKNLAPPLPEKQFLISPPASPPVGWEPIEENKPAFNFDLVSTLVEMAPGQTHELHKSSDGKPSVVVHVVESTRTNDTPKMKIQQTKRPET